MDSLSELLQSKEETYFYWYLEELKSHRFIDRYKYQPKPFTLVKPVHGVRIIHGVRKTRTKSFVILRPHTYQADFLIYWRKSAEKIFYITIEELLEGTYFNLDHYPFIANKVKAERLYDNKIEAFSVVDVKGSYNQNDAYRRFSNEQKLVMEKAKIYVQKIIPAPAISKAGKIKTPSALFYRTFTPERYLLTDISNDKRKIRYPVKTIEQFANSMKSHDQLNLKL